MTPNKKTPRTRGAKDPKAPNPAFAFLLDYMKKHPDVAYADAAAAAMRAGYKVFPIMWGRAQMMLGRVKAKPRGEGKAAVKKAKARAKAKAEAEPAAPPVPTAAQTPAGPASRPAAPRRSPTFQRSAHLPVTDSDLNRARDLVDRINAGHRAVLLYDGDEWVLAVE